MRGSGPGTHFDFQTDLQQAMDSALGAGHDIKHGHLLVIYNNILPTWNSFAKNSYNQIDRRSLQYVVHRYFLRAHSLSVVGLEPIHGNGSFEEAQLLSHYAPSYVKRVLESKGEHSGFSIEDTVALVATLERLIADSHHDLLDGIYKASNIAPNTQLSEEQLLEHGKAYLVRWMLGDDQDSIDMLEANQSLVYESFDDWDGLVAFLKGQINAFKFQRHHSQHHWTASAAWTPLVPNFASTDVHQILSSVTMSFGRFWETECARVKGSLTQMDRSMVGRVKLSDFHAAALDGEWRFSESKEYLRQLGALDESSMWGPHVIIPNYMQGASNCIVSAQHYRVCCTNECEDYISEFEAHVGGPDASPEDVLQVLHNLTVSMEDRQVLIQGSLRSQLFEIARTGHGRIPLHGRLFSQWLHYVFPQECPFPHKSGTVSSASPTQFGLEYMATAEEMTMHAVSGLAQANETYGEDDWMTQWSEEEELITDHLRLKDPWKSLILTPAVGAGLAAAIVLAIVLTKRGGTGEGKDLLPVASPLTMGKMHRC